jgi:hypothetical protein
VKYSLSCTEVTRVVVVPYDTSMWSDSYSSIFIGEIPSLDCTLSIMVSVLCGNLDKIAPWSITPDLREIAS